MDCLRLVPGVFRLLGILFIVMVIYQPCCQGLIAGRMSVASTNTIRKFGANVRPTTRKTLLIRKVKPPTEATIIHKTMIVPSSRVTSCVQSRCPASVPKACRVLSVSYLGGSRCRRCVIKRSCRVSKPTQKIIQRKVKTMPSKPQKMLPRKLKTISSKPTKKMVPRNLKTISSKQTQKMIPRKLKIMSSKPSQKMIPNKLKTMSSKSTKNMIPRKVKTAPKSKNSRTLSARMKNAIIRSRTRADVNNFEGRWRKGFSSG